MTFWQDKKVVIVGGGGFLGSHVTELLVKEGANVKAITRSSRSMQNLYWIKNKINITQKDLGSLEDCRSAVKGSDIVLNLAARVGGVGYNVKHPARMFFDNAYVSIMLLEAAHLENVERYELTSTVDVYANTCTIPTPETEGLKDEPEVTSAGYGWAKRMAELQARFYSQEYGMKIAVVRPAGIYGPRDDFDKERSHVIPSLIMKVLETKSSISIWGSGKQKRSFVYVKDVAQGVLDATEKFTVASPLNLGTETEIEIRDLAALIVKITGRDLKMEFDLTKPEGYNRKKPDVSKAKSEIQWNPKYSLEEGIRETIEWYKGSQKSSN